MEFIMEIYVILEAIVGIVLAVVIAKRAKKADGVAYGALDRAGRVTNVLLSILYIPALLACMLLGAIGSPCAEGFLWVIALIVALINSSAPLFAALGIGFSVALRKQGKSKASFLVQFAGILGIALTFALSSLFSGSLLSTLN